MLAFALVRHSFKGKAAGNILVFVPMATPEIVLGASLLTIFVQGFNQIGLKLGFWTIVIAHIMFCVSFVALTVKARVRGFDWTLEDASLDLGCSPWRTFRKVTFPLILPGIMAAALLSFALTFWMRSHFNVQADFATIMVPTILQGGALAFFFIPLSAITLNGLTPDRIPSASGLSNFVRITAGAMGTSAVTTIWDNRATLHHAHMVEHITPTDPAAVGSLAALQSGGLSYEQAAAQISRLIDQQAFTRAADDVFLASAWLFLCLIPIIWLARPRQGGSAVDAGGAH